MSMDEALDRMHENVIKLTYRFAISETPSIFALYMLSLSFVISILFPNCSIKNDFFITSVVIFCLKSFSVRAMYVWYALKEYSYDLVSVLFLIASIVIPPTKKYVCGFIILFSIILYLSVWIRSCIYDVRCFLDPSFRTEQGQGRQNQHRYYKNIDRYAENINQSNMYMSLGVIIIIANMTASYYSGHYRP